MEKVHKPEIPGEGDQESEAESGRGRKTSFGKIKSQKRISQGIWYEGRRNQIWYRKARAGFAHGN